MDLTVTHELCHLVSFCSWFPITAPINITCGLIKQFEWIWNWTKHDFNLQGALYTCMPLWKYFQLLFCMQKEQSLPEILFADHHGRELSNLRTLLGAVRHERGHRNILRKSSKLQPIMQVCDNVILLRSCQLSGLKEGKFYGDNTTSWHLEILN